MLGGAGVAGFRPVVRGPMLGVAALLAGCGGPQSALVPGGRDAERVLDLFWWMAGGALVIWAVVLGIAVYASRMRPGEHDVRTANLLIVGGGVVFPTVVLAGLLAYGLSLMPRPGEVIPPTEGTARGQDPPDTPGAVPGGALPRVRIAVSGEQWWWRVRYLLPGGGEVELANELHLPVGEPAELVLTSPDVIHSFWVPSLAGKMDMIPGRVTRLALEPTRTGVYRGACAEYCGASHALMAFYVVVEERPAYEAWLAEQRTPAEPLEAPRAVRGRDLFLASGCGACHTVRGTPADGTVGPDLTHVGSRESLGAGVLENDREAFHRWLARTKRIKPEVHMPAFGMLPADDLRALAAYLEDLE